MLTERLSKNVKFQQNTEQSEGVNHEAENTSRSKEKKNSKDTLNNIVNNFGLTCV